GGPAQQVVDPLAGEDRAFVREAGDPHVVQRGQRPEQPDVLEGAREAQLVDLVRLPSVDPLAADPDLPVGGRVDAGQEVEGGGLPRSVGPDQALEVTAADLQIEAVQRAQAAELDAHLHRLEKHLAAHVIPLRVPGHHRGNTSQISRVPNSPWGRTSIKTTSSMPYT